MPTEISDKEAKRAAARAGLARAKQWRDDKRDAKSPSIKKEKKSSNQSGAPKSSSSIKKKKSTPAKRTSSKAKKVAVAEEAPAEATTYRKTPSREDRARAREKARQWSSNRKDSKKQKSADDAEKEDKGIPKVVETKSNDNGTDDTDDFKTAAETESKAAVVSAHDLKEIQCMKSDMTTICTRFGILSDKFAENLGIDGHEKSDKDDSDAMDCE